MLLTYHILIFLKQEEEETIIGAGGEGIGVGAGEEIGGNSPISWTIDCRLLTIASY